MRVAALYDIHGNIDALDAVLEDVETKSIDLILIGGDISWGAFPAEAVGRVVDLGERALVIRGNTDRELVSPPETGEPTWIDEVTNWCLEQLSPSQRDFLRSLPLSESVTVRDLGDVLFCHATPRSDDEILTVITPNEDVEELLAKTVQGLIVCGHTHTQFDRRVGRHRIVNAGSVGMPYEDKPGAYWAIFGDDVELRRTEYDFEAAAERIRKSGCPHADGFADAVTSPRSGQEATQKFESGRLQMKNTS